MTRTFVVADLFCGAGGSSSGAARAIRAMGAELDLVCVNHWATAVATHSRNHPRARHYCVNLDAARPEELVPEGYLDLMMASPSCVHFSRARGGKPVSDQKRADPWHVQRWATVLDVRCILVENVAELVTWGPLLPDGSIDPKRKGDYFAAWTRSLWDLGYQVEWRVLNAADFGDATTRRRLFIQARKDGVPIRWPEATHRRRGGKDLTGGMRPWKAAAEVIDLEQPGPSIFARPRPLSVNTRMRIARGLAQFCGALAPLYIDLLDLPDDKRGLFAGAGGEAVRPFVVAQRNNNVPKDTREPLPTFTTTTGGGVSLVQPSLAPFVLGQQSGAVARDTAEPLPTIATGGAIALLQPSIVEYHGTADHAHAAGEPLPTITTKARFGLCQPAVVKFYGTSSHSDISQPLPTITAQGQHLGLASPLVVPYGPRAGARPASEPLPTILTKDRLGLATPFLVPQFGEREGQAPRVHPVADPLPAVTSHGAGGLVSPVVVQMAQTGRQDAGTARSVQEPLPTLTTRRNVAVASATLGGAPAGVDPRRLVVIDGQVRVLDIRFRMLRNRELARAMGFDEGEIEYEFVGTQEEQTKQIGNAVSVATAKALVTAILGAGEMAETLAS